MEVNKNFDDEFIIIGAGLRRTGTYTLKNVLSDLLGRPCYRMYDVTTGQSHHLDFWMDLFQGKEKSREKWKKLLAGYSSGVDFSLCYYYKELMVNLFYCFFSGKPSRRSKRIA